VTSSWSFILKLYTVVYLMTLLHQAA